MQFLKKNEKICNNVVTFYNNIHAFDQTALAKRIMLGSGITAARESAY